MNPSEIQTPPPVESRQRPDRWLNWLLSLPVLWTGTILAFLSIADGIRNSILHSLDFQWSPARLLAHHVDPWATYLAGDPGHQILLNQVPNDLHELYVAILPFGYLPLVPAKIIWAMINMALVILSCLLVARLYELTGRKTWLFLLIVLTITSARVTIGNGQVTALVLASLGLWAVTRSSDKRGLLLGIAWAKYSVPPVLAAFLLLRRRWRLLLYSLAPPAAGFLFFYGWLHTPFWTLLWEPFRTATNNVSPGLANIMAVSEIALRHPPLFRPVPDAFYLSPGAGWTPMIPYLCGTAMAIGIATYFFARGKQVDGRILMACLTTACLLCFKHQIYDFLFLMFPLAIALKADRSAARNWLFGLIAYLWYGERLLHIRRWEFWPAVVIVSFFLLLALIAATWKLRDHARWKTHWQL
ncbi:MAG TPA: glycosyltransferase family 87 protein [Acidobacteriaceae bacterium]|nr:glycosyltransferase family 87 protein [Acidobacteriaceae bacterium]